jgi:hypothetical protein
MRIGVVADDLITISRIATTAAALGAEVVRIDRPADAPSGIELLLVDWASRHDSWIGDLHGLRAAGRVKRVVLFGPHRDVEAHQAARNAGLGPMLARSKLFADLPNLLAAREVLRDRS